MAKKRERSTTKSSKSEGEESTAPAKSDVTRITQDESPSGNKKRGWDAIESLFDDKKQDKKDRVVEQQEQKKLNDEYRKQEKSQRASAGSASASASGGTTNFSAKEKWADDGLGGKYNAEGFTGRVQEGVKVFKAHLLSKPGAGSSDQCPFDCECCYI
jgi:hypothetical protein